MDALSDVLKALRLESAVYLNAEFTAPWCVQSKFGLDAVMERLAFAEHVMFFHFLTQGTCKLRLAGTPEVIDAVAGDMVLFPQDHRHVMGSHLNLPPMDAEELASSEATIVDGDFIHVRSGGGGEATRFVCGYLACSRNAFRPFLEGLPRVMHVPLANDPAATVLRELLRMGVRESAAATPGAASALAKLSELMVTEAIRRYVEALPPKGKGWLAGVRDAYVGRALALMHAAPNKAWTVDELARDVALSRSALAERFTTLMGEPPMKYLTRWRLGLAAQMLRSGRDAIVRVAENSGYESEAAFSRAFKREFGMPPAGWRRAARPAST